MGGDWWPFYPRNLARTEHVQVLTDLELILEIARSQIPERTDWWVIPAPVLTGKPTALWFLRTKNQALRDNITKHRKTKQKQPATQNCKVIHKERQPCVQTTVPELHRWAGGPHRCRRGVCSLVSKPKQHRFCSASIGHKRERGVSLLTHCSNAHMYLEYWYKTKISQSIHWQSPVVLFSGCYSTFPQSSN